MKAQPIVKKENGLFRLYEGDGVIAHAATAQLMIEHLNAIYPKGTKVRWVIVPRRLALPARSKVRLPFIPALAIAA